MHLDWSIIVADGFYFLCKFYKIYCNRHIIKLAEGVVNHSEIETCLTHHTIPCKDQSKNSVAVWVRHNNKYQYIISIISEKYL